MERINPSRRSALGILATGPVAMLPALAVMQCSAPADASHAGLEAELARFSAVRAYLDGGGATDTEWAEWGDWQDRLYRRIEALPATAENVRIRALAIREMHHDSPELDDLFQNGTTDARLARQLIRSLLSA